MMWNKFKSNTGITLVEILSALVVVGILASLAAPRFESAMSNIRFKSANRDLQGSFRYARSMALTDKKQYGVYVDSDTRTVTIFRDSVDLANYTFDPPEDSTIRVDTLPEEIHYIYADFDNSVLTFAPNGTAGFTGGGTGGANVMTYGYLSGRSLAYNLEVKRATGRVKGETVNYETVDN